MRRVVLVAFAIVGLTACGSSEQGTAGAGAPTDSGTPAEVGAQAIISTNVATCLELVAAENWGEGARICAMAHVSYPDDAQVKAALDRANLALAAEPPASDAVGLQSGEAAGEAADDAAEQAKEALPN